MAYFFRTRAWLELIFGSPVLLCSAAMTRTRTWLLKVFRVEANANPNSTLSLTLRSDMIRQKYFDSELHCLQSLISSHLTKNRNKYGWCPKKYLDNDKIMAKLTLTWCRAAQSVVMTGVWDLESDLSIVVKDKEIINSTFVTNELTDL